MLERLEKLCGLYGVSGREKKVSDYIVSQLEGKAEYSLDNVGNILAFKKGKKTPHKKVMFSAHMDEVGLIITYITDDGFLKFDTVGGIDISVLMGRNVLVGDALLPGVIGVKPIHLLKGDEKEKFPEKDSLYIDIGAQSREEAARHVSLGDSVFFDSQYVTFGNGFVKARAIDDRAGCALMLDMIDGEAEYDTWYAFTTREETGHSGASAASYTVKPDIAIILEATTAADIAGVSDEKKVCLLGGGPVISIMDRRTIYPRELTDLAFELAQKNDIKAQTKTVIAGGNDAGAIQSSAGGVKVLAVSLACRYLHSPSCVIKGEDYIQTLKLLKLLARELPVS